MLQSKRDHPNNFKNNFICGWYLEDPILDKLIDYHNVALNKTPGTVGLSQVNKEYKDSTDTIIPDFLKNDYFTYLSYSINYYTMKYPACVNSCSPWRISQPVNIQHYAPGQGYHMWHCERTGGARNNLRHLVFLTYLNDVTDGGETEFLYQGLKVKPEKGLTLIWPTDWNFLHRGVTSPSQHKYIATGWLEYV